MTSINALRLDRDSGLLVCDEARYWNPEWMIFYTPEKIRSIIREDITRNQGIVLFMGQTGTSSIGDEWIQESRREIAGRYDAFLQQQGNTSDKKFMHLKELADLVFEVITRIKHTHVDDFLKGKFGFSGAELISGKYSRGGADITVSDEELVSDVIKYMTFKGSPEEVKGIYGNSQILAGYHPDEGFRIFYMTEKWPICEEVQEFFTAQGSGRDTTDIVFSRFADTRSLRMRKHRDPIPRAEALFVMLQGLNTACNQTAGVGGYPKIIYINGKQPDPGQWITEICDHRSRLAAEITAAATENMISKETAIQLLERLIFKGEPFGEINQALFRAVGDPLDLFRFLRGWPEGMRSGSAQR